MTFISDNGSALVSQVFIEVAGFLGITLKPTTAKHVEAIGLPERSTASIKQALKTEKDKQRSL